MGCRIGGPLCVWWWNPTVRWYCLIRVVGGGEHQRQADFVEHARQFAVRVSADAPRNLRHTFGTLAIKAGTDISVVARQLGHSDIQTTARYYLKPDLSVLKDMQKAWQKLILTC